MVGGGGDYRYNCVSSANVDWKDLKPRLNLFSLATLTTVLILCGNRTFHIGGAAIVHLYPVHGGNKDWRSVMS